MSDDNQHAEELAVITVVTKPGDYFNVLMQSCERHDIKITVLGMGAKWHWFCTKLNLVFYHLSKSDALPYTLFVDGFDSIFQAGLSEIWRSYQNFKIPIVVGADMGCWPETSLERKFPPSPTKFRFLNSGGYIGPTKMLVRALGIMGCPFKNEHQDDQGKFSYYFLAHQQEMKLDYHGEIFQTLNWNEGAVEFRARERAYITRSSGKKPHILHLNGHVSKNLSYAKNLGYNL